MRYEADMALIRHGMTPGNEEHRYIGRTDEPLSQKGREQLLTLQKKGVYPAAACVAASPLERCRQTAELLSPRTGAMRFRSVPGDGFWRV
ncbi:MAG: histidine phosphatase family protein [Roseburia hominis]